MMRLRLMLPLCLLLCVFPEVSRGESQTGQAVILVTIDGLRPEELFTGAEKNLIDAQIGGVYNPDRIRGLYWHEDPQVRRTKLMPFIWEVVANRGQVFGSWSENSHVTVKNGKYFSYPGYQELLCGYPDDAIDSNDKNYNRNVTVLEWLNNRPGFEGKVVTFGSWDAIPYIVNDQRAGMYVNAGWQEFEHVTDPARRDLLNETMRELPHLWEYARFDYLTVAGAIEYLRAREPRVMYISLDETDDWCHAGRYDLYLESARRADGYLRQLWDFIESHEAYRGRTSLVVTVDHGRGHGREGWKNHSADLPGSEKIWIAVLGPVTPSLGVRKDVEATQGQVAATVAAFVGEDYAATDERIAQPLPDATGLPSTQVGQVP